ncbi:hypothetical protein A1351_18505 [Methylosinus sp. R-45379]|uniref:DUF7674 family protein n=1 Tax=unclassified Methylosinus TaxID=2624500 RepID=UPI0004671874|nr:MULTISPECIES: hypothetical protein [unclassified Methylosinus]OAI23998.1 hypothetical protein A1351_18505 [Methylosinus sp. R-45379]
MMGREELLGALVAASGGVQAAYEEILDAWGSEEPPVTTLLAALGYRIAEDFDSTDVDANRRLFSLIEQAMESGDNGLRTVVATGLIEALAVRAVQTEGLWKRMAPLLGPRSLYHAEAWLSE